MYKKGDRFEFVHICNEVDNEVGDIIELTSEQNHEGYFNYHPISEKIIKGRELNYDYEEDQEIALWYLDMECKKIEEEENE